jgi:diguanylate cyclase (GGDEF)-like protein/PAS domain S-box-containing protein
MFSFDDSAICRSILESLPTGVCVLDLQKRIVLWSGGAERITGYLRHEVIGHSCIAEPLLHCDQPGCEFCSEECAVARAMKTSQGAEVVGFLHHKAGHEIPVQIHAVPVHNEHGSIIGAVETFSEIQQGSNSDRGDPLRHLPESIDPTTGLANRVAMQSHLKHALASSVEMHLPFMLLLLRVEGLSHFRSAFGNEAASSFLRVVARTLESALWVTDYIGRWTDDQFAVVLSGCTEEALPAVRERIRRMLAGEGIEWWGERRSLPTSIAEAVPQPEDNVASLIGRAEKILESASAWRNAGFTAPAGEAPGS